MTRIAWYVGNWCAQIVHAFRVGYRDGQGLRPGTRPRAHKGDHSEAL